MDQIQSLQSLLALGPTAVYLGAVYYLYRRIEAIQAENKKDLKELLDRYENAMIESIKTLTIVAERLDDDK